MSIKSLPRKVVFLSALFLLFAVAFRLFVALRLPNDTPDDGRVYAQIARNVLEQHVYSHAEQAPFAPSLIRLPGYPFLLATVYVVVGHSNNTAVRVVQALIDTATCLLIAAVAFQWTDDPRRKWIAAISALALAAVCPFTTIYVATILTEVSTNFLAVLLCLLATLAFKSSGRRSLVLWFCAGLTAGTAVFFRPDSGLFAAAVGITIMLSAFSLGRSQPNFSGKFSRAVGYSAVFSLAFCLVLLPWTIRNYRVFGVFQPLAPAHGEMPGEFVPRGYLTWLRTWLDDGRYVGPVLWNLDTSRINMTAFPRKAFDSPEEKDRVAALLAKYNGLEQQAQSPPALGTISAVPNPSPAPSPSAAAESQKQQDQNEESDKGSDDDSADADDSTDESGNVEMTPEIDAQFAQIARERIARAPFRYYLTLPLKRAVSLWFDTHSQYYPFDGDLFPLEDLDYDIHQQYWLPLFAGLTWIYTILGAIGAWVLLRGRESNPRKWFLLVTLIVFLRLGFFSTLENPEPRYTVEIFPFLTILGGVALSSLFAILLEKFLSPAN